MVRYESVGATIRSNDIGTDQKQTFIISCTIPWFCSFAKLSFAFEEVKFNKVSISNINTFSNVCWKYYP